MINFADTQKSIIKLLRADNNLVTALGNVDKIKEVQYQDTAFVLPAVRVDLSPQAPIGNGKNRIILSTVSFRVDCFSEEKSSKECNNLMSLVVKALFNKQDRNGLDSNNVHTFDILRINCTGSDPAYRMFERYWQGSVYFESEVNDIYHPESNLVYPV